MGYLRGEETVELVLVKNAWGTQGYFFEEGVSFVIESVDCILHPERHNINNKNPLGKYPNFFPKFLNLFSKFHI